MITISALLMDGVITPSRELTEQEKGTVIASYFLGQSYVLYQTGEEDFVLARERAIETMTTDIQSDSDAINLIASIMEEHGDKYLEAYMLELHQTNIVVE